MYDNCMKRYFIMVDHGHYGGGWRTGFEGDSLEEAEKRYEEFLSEHRGRGQVRFFEVEPE